MNTKSKRHADICTLARILAPADPIQERRDLAVPPVAETDCAEELMMAEILQSQAVELFSFDVGYEISLLEMRSRLTSTEAGFRASKTKIGMGDQ